MAQDHWIGTLRVGYPSLFITMAQDHWIGALRVGYPSLVRIRSCIGGGNEWSNLCEFIQHI
eukprot:1114796-Pelagomonas_calceolata.AAC.2